MIDAPRLLKDLQRLLGELEDDLRQRVGAVPGLDADLRAQHRAAKAAGRAGDAYDVWRDAFLTQVAVAWILGCVFVRFLELRAAERGLRRGPHAHHRRDGRGAAEGREARDARRHGWHGRHGRHGHVIASPSPLPLAGEGSWVRVMSIASRRKTRFGGFFIGP